MIPMTTNVTIAIAAGMYRESKRSGNNYRVELKYPAEVIELICSKCDMSDTRSGIVGSNNRRDKFAMGLGCQQVMIRIYNNVI